MSTRIYIITPKTAEAGKPATKRLVRATNQAQALRFITSELNVTVASQDDLVTALGAGIKVENDGKPPQTS